MKRFVLLIALLMLVIPFPLCLFAQEKEVTLEEVVVTATRDAEEIRKIPANVTVITRDQIEQVNARTTVDVLRDKADVFVRDLYGNGKAASVDIRGFGETGALNTLVLVDGRRVNEIDLSGVDWTQIPIDQIERIEIVRGSGSVLYGDNAVGGVVNIITKKPEKPFSARAEVVGGSYGYNRESASAGGKWGPLSGVLSASYSGTEGYRENSFLKATDVGGKIIYDLNQDIRFNINGSFHHDDTGLPGELPKIIYDTHRRAALHPDDRAGTDDGYGSFGVKARLWDWGRIEADLSYRQREVADRFYFFSFKDQRNLKTFGLTPRYILEKPLFNFPNKFTFGFDFYDSDSDNFSESAFGANHSEIKKRSFGLYGLDEFSVLENLILSLGYRHEWVTYHLFQESPFLKDEVRDGKPAWNVALDYLFGKKSSAFFSIKRSFRFPASDELVQFVFIPPNLEARVNPDMKPQVGYHYELGLRYAFTEQFEANLTLFWADLKNEIFFNPQTFTNENFPETRRQGIEIGARGRPLPWLSLWGNYSYVKPTLRSEPSSDTYFSLFPPFTPISIKGNDIPGVPRHKGSFGVDIDFPKGFLFNIRNNIVGARYFISDWSNQVHRQHGYYTLDAKLTYSWKGLKVFAGVNNLFNEKYSEFGVIDASGSRFYYPSPERNFIGGVSYTF
jgi:iron complex outermembrane receptor protein